MQQRDMKENNRFLSIVNIVIVVSYNPPEK